MSTPAAKRRRIELSTNALNKPFRSPLKTLSQPKDNPPKDSHPLRTVTDDFDTPPKINKIQTPQSTELHSDPLPSSPQPPQITTPQSRPTRRSRPGSRLPPSTHPYLRTLRQELIALESRTRTLQADIQTIAQAESIQSRDATAQLVTETKRWREVAQQAAEEMFGVAKERVVAMGGLRMWRKEQEERRRWWDDGGEEERGNGNVDEEQESLEGWAEREPRGEEQGAEGGNGGGDDEEDDGFTMDMMLRSLHIDPELIGYDKELQRWIN
ncbi:MAG: hypothetical protein M1822_009809 [Bathelium mastoideum]|nr:MAG: hypothetical protein M1822_009809 [Bathelium mastoideum]